MLFVRVVSEVEELIGLMLPKVDELMRPCSHPEVGRGIVMPGAMVITVVESFSPIARLLSL